MQMLTQPLKQQRPLSGQSQSVMPGDQHWDLIPPQSDMGGNPEDMSGHDDDITSALC